MSSIIFIDVLSPIDFLTNPAWVSIIVAFIVGIITAIAPLFASLFNRKRQELTYKVLTDSAIVPDNAKAVVKISLGNDPDPIDNANLFILNIRNTG